MRKIWAWILCIIIAVSLAGCQGSGGQDSNNKNTAGTEPQSDADQQSNKENTAASSSDEMTELIFWHCMNSPYMELLEEMSDQFNETVGKENNINVQMVFQDWPGTEKLFTLIQSNDISNLPDVFQMYGVGINFIRDYERMVWVEDIINSEESTIKKEELIEQSIGAFSIDGRMLGAPMNMTSILLFYNKDLFEAAGLDPESPPATLAEVAEYCEKLKDVAPHGLTLCPDTYELGNWIMGQGGGSLYGNNQNGHSGYMTEIEFGNNGTLDSFMKEWEKVINSGGLKHTKDDYNAEFANQETAMLIVSSSKLSTLKELADGSFNMGVAQLPTVQADDHGGVALGGGGLFVLDKDDPAKVNAASLFVQYVLSEDVQSFLFNRLGYFPSNKASIESQMVKELLAETPEYQVVIDAVMNSNPEVQDPFYLNYDEINSIIRNNLQMFAEGSYTREEAYEALLEETQTSINNYLRANPID